MRGEHAHAVLSLGAHPHAVCEEDGEAAERESGCRFEGGWCEAGAEGVVPAADGSGHVDGDAGGAVVERVELSELVGGEGVDGCAELGDEWALLGRYGQERGFGHDSCAF